MIASQNPTASYVAGYYAWRVRGRFVRKGEQGILILAPIVRAKNSMIEPNDKDESSTPVGFRAAYMFDISQTDGKKIPEIGIVTGNPTEQRERLIKLIAEQDIALEYSQDIAPARGRSSGGKITMLPGQSAAADFATLVHELAHLCGAGIYVAQWPDKRGFQAFLNSTGHIICGRSGSQSSRG